MLEVHTYHSFGVSYYNSTCLRDEGVCNRVSQVYTLYQHNIMLSPLLLLGLMYILDPVNNYSAASEASARADGPRPPIPFYDIVISDEAQVFG